MVKMVRVIKNVSKRICENRTTVARSCGTWWPWWTDVTRTTQLVKLASHFESFSNYPSVRSLKLSGHQEKENGNMNLWKWKRVMRTYWKEKRKYGSMEKENGNTDLWKRADGGRPDVCSWDGGGEPPSPSWLRPRESRERKEVLESCLREQNDITKYFFSFLEKKIINQTLDEKANQKL